MPSKKLTSSDPKAVTAIVAVCGVVPQATCDPVSLRCKLFISFAADDSRIEEAAAAYERGELTVNVSAYERAGRIVADVLRTAKQNAAPRDAEEAAYIAMKRETAKNRQIANAPTPFATWQESLLVREKNEADARAAAVNRTGGIGYLPDGKPERGGR